jgi:hypothetical protein
MNFLRNKWVQLSAVVIFLSTIGIHALRLKYAVRDPDLFWHLKVGDWIIEHSALPQTGILSRTAANLPWVAYSWGYEVLLSLSYSAFGLVGVGIFGVALTVLVAFFLCWMLRRLSGQVWFSVALAAITCSAFLFNGMPRPMFLSEVLFAVTLTLLLDAQRRTRIQTLYWLPLVFFLWANLHIQFIYGLFAIGLFVGINSLQRILAALHLNLDRLLPPTLPLKSLLAILALCFAATLVGPNFYKPYLVVLSYSKAKFTYSVISELQPLSFRGYSHFVELFIGAAGFYAIGWRKKLDLFKLTLLAFAAVLAFRTMRDAWFLCFSAAACIADYSEGAPVVEPPAKSWRNFAIVSAIVLLVLFVSAPATDFSMRTIDRSISADYPVNAVNFLRRNPVPGPLYNNLTWGGFLMWYLPELPVAIDGRNDLYGDDLDKLFYESESAFPSYATDPYLDQAGVVILDSKLPLAKILTIDPRFNLVYRDDIATVFARHSAALSSRTNQP